MRNGCNLPWVCMGDFNQILSGEEKRGGNPIDETNALEFREALEFCGLLDCGYEGYPFTWENSRENENYIEERLDRCVANWDWKLNYPNHKVSHLDWCGSDHCPILLTTAGKEEEEIRWGWYFKVEPLWLQDPECAEIIKKTCEANAGAGLSDILNICKADLLKWSRQKSGDIRRKIERVEGLLSSFKYKPKTRIVLEQRRALEAERAELIYQEELFWKQRSRMDWLKGGDKNSKFFHTKASARRKRNTIRMLQDDGGRIYKGQKEVMSCLSDYYQTLFKKGSVPDSDKVIQALEQKITPGMNEQLLRPFKPDEVKLALDQMAPNKAPGSDGFSAGFYQKNWNAIGPKVTETVLNFLNSGIMPPEFNHTLIALIPKVKSPSTAKEFRPISLCRVIYKIISKVLANRLKVILNDIISEEQSAFVPRRCITDNVIIAFECFQFMKNRKKAKDGYFAAKLDMAKAYDRVEWSFLEKVMRKLGFDGRWVNIIMSCVTSVSYSVLVNGHKTDCFIPSRGLRQGDPLSPYLFLLCAEGLSALIKKAEKEGQLNGIQIRKKAPTISHLLFADDSLVFGRAVLSECDTLKGILKCYEEESGQLINYNKSEISFSTNVKTSRRLEIGGTLKIKEVTKHPKYLGLPTVVGRSKKEMFEDIKEKVRKKLKDWKIRTLSQAGKEIMIKAVAQAQFLYPMAVFLIPEGTLKEIQSLISNFWWGQKGKERKLHWLSWEDLCEEKEYGGMGFRDLRSFNLAMLGRQVWKIISQPNSLLTRTLKASYFPKSDILNAKTGYNPSFIWRSIMAAKDKIVEGFRWRVGDGKLIRIWDDAWIPGKTYFFADPQPGGVDSEEKVSSLIIEDSGCWDERLLKEKFSKRDCELISKIPLRYPLNRDEKVWTDTDDGKYSVKSAYSRIRENQGNTIYSLNLSMDDLDFWKTLWKTHIPPKIRQFLWKVGRGILPVGRNLVEWMDDASTECPFCGLPETQTHALRECSWIRRRWQAWEGKQLFELGEGKSSYEWLKEVWGKCPNDLIQKFSVVLWYLWKERCNHLFNNAKIDEEMVIPKALGWLQSFLDAHPPPPISGDDSQIDRREGWTPPPIGVFKMNSDAGLLGQQGVGFGCVIRDSSGNFCGATAKKERGICRPIEAEAKAIIMGIREANRRGLSPFIVETDCLRLIHKLEKEENDTTELGIWCEEIKKLAKANEVLSGVSTRWGYTHRKNNSIAHWLAHSCFCWDRQFVWVDNPPTSLLLLLQADLGQASFGPN
ncbi:unnamed protein product [Linum trigynum]|uniref:Reverse transcriptase domain-containing protein n=1 Tax=Linum trigynum TaxID=586398 RepID=A0AAV2FJ35_9ROSI